MLALLAVPIFSVVVPPLGDYINHLARMHVLSAYADSAALQTNYVVIWKLTPYLGMDLIVPRMIRFMNIYTAGRVFLCVCLLQFVLGTAAVHAALFRRFSPWPVASALFAYSWVFSLGFVNYLFGAGVWLLAFASWIVLSRRPPAWRIAIGSVLSFAVFFSHYFAFFGYMLCVGTYELGVWLSARDRSLLRRGAIAFCPFIIPLIIFWYASQEQGGGITRYGTPHEKLTALLSPVAFPGARFDLIILGFSLVVLAAGLLMRKLRLATAMHMPLAALGLAAVAMPILLSGVWGIDYRLPVVFVYLLIASCEWRDVRARIAFPTALVMVLLLAANIGSIVLAWQPLGKRFDEFRAALQVIPRGARVIAFREDVGVDPELRRGPLFLYTHLPLLAVIERDAYVPYLFKHPMMSIAAAPALRSIDTPHGHPMPLPNLIEGLDPVKGPAMLGEVDPEGRHNYWGDWPSHYDYAIELSFGAHPELPAQLKLLKSGQIFNIYRIDKFAR